MFNEVVNHRYGKSLCRILLNVSELNDPQIKDTYLPRYADILFNNSAVCILRNLPKNLDKKFLILERAIANQNMEKLY